MASRITGSITKSSNITDTAVTISATGRFTYRSGTYGYTVDGYIQIGSSKKTFNDAKSSTSGGSFTAVSHSVTIPRTRADQTITITLYGYCDEGSSEDKSTVTTTVTVPALPSYAVTLNYNDSVTPTGSATKWFNDTLTLPTPTRDGYSFLGWSDGTSNIGTTYLANAAITLTAQWKINNIPPSITSKNCQRVTGDKTKAVFTIEFSAGKNADGSISAVSSIKIEYKLLSDNNWHELTTIHNPLNSPVTYTGGTFLETETYSIRYTISDTNYGGLTAADILTKTSYIWKAKKGDQGFDFGVPVTVNEKRVLLEDDIPPIPDNKWIHIKTSTGTTSATFDLSPYNEVLVVADITRNSAHHLCTAVIPVECLYSTQYELKLTGGNYGASSANATIGVWYKISKTGGAGVAAYINGTNFVSATTFKIYAR